jgi:hypothetical protein
VDLFGIGHEEWLLNTPVADELNRLVSAASRQQQRRRTETQGGVQQKAHHLKGPLRI